MVKSKHDGKVRDMAKRRNVVERFYNTTTVAEMLGRRFRQDLEKEVRTDKYITHPKIDGVTLYRWSDSTKNAKMFMSETDANKIRVFHGLDEIDVEPIPKKDRYDTAQIAEILGLSQVGVYTIHRSGELELEPEHQTKISIQALRNWFGAGALRDTPLEVEWFHSPEEVADILGISRKRIWTLIEAGHLETLADSYVTRKLTIGHKDLMEWIDTREDNKVKQRRLQKAEVAS